MFHDRRLWADPTPLPDDVEEAVREIRRCSTWTLCTAWSWGGLVLLNDATSEDGAFELAVVVVDPEPVRRVDTIEARAYAQVESLTAGWMTKERLVETLSDLRARFGDREAVGVVRSGGPKRTGFFYVDVETPHVCDACR